MNTVDLNNQTIRSTYTLASNTKYTGAVTCDCGGSNYAFKFPAGGDNIDLSGMKFVIKSGGALFHDGFNGVLGNVTLSTLDRRTEVTGTPTTMFAIMMYGSTRNLIADGLYGHDLGSAYLAEIWAPQSGSALWWVFDNVGQGGHFFDVGADFKLAYWVGRGIVRCPLEIQQHPGANAGNAITKRFKPFACSFFDYRSLGGDSYGISFMPQWGEDNEVSYCYFRASFHPTARMGNGYSDNTGSQNSQVGAYALEWGTKTGRAHHNTFVSPGTVANGRYKRFVSASMTNSDVAYNWCIGAVTEGALLVESGATSPSFNEASKASNVLLSIDKDPGPPPGALARLKNPMGPLPDVGQMYWADPTIKKLGDGSQVDSAVSAATGMSAPGFTVNDAATAVTFTGVKAGDTLSIQGSLPDWHIIGTCSEGSWTWNVPSEFDNWFVRAIKNNRGALESKPVPLADKSGKLIQLHYAPVCPPPPDLDGQTVASLTARVADLTAQLKAKTIDADTYKAKLDQVTAEYLAYRTRMISEAQR